MDPVYVLTQRLNQFSECMRAAGVGNVEAPSLEDWLTFWNDDDTTVGNLQNLDHWLDLARRSRPVRSA